MNHQRDRVVAAVTPSWHDVAVASEAIIEELRRAGYRTTGELFEPVAARFSEEPLPDVAREIEGVTESDIRRVRSSAATTSALAHLESWGGILPVGPHHYHHTKWGVPYNFGGTASTYNVDGPFNYAIAEGYRLPLGEDRSPLIDSPAVFLQHAPASMGTKVRRVLLEAVNAYRATLYLSTAVLLGVASEAAWDQLARALHRAKPDEKLRAAIEDPLMSAFEVQRRVLSHLRGRGVKDAVLGPIELTAQAYRDLRNYATHDPDETFDPTRIARPAVGVLLAAAVDYFRRLYDLHDRAAELGAPSS